MPTSPTELSINMLTHNYVETAYTPNNCHPQTLHAWGSQPLQGTATPWMGFRALE